MRSADLQPHRASASSPSSPRSPLRAPWGSSSSSSSTISSPSSVAKSAGALTLHLSFPSPTNRRSLHPPHLKHERIPLNSDVQTTASPCQKALNSMPTTHAKWMDLIEDSSTTGQGMLMSIHFRVQDMLNLFFQQVAPFNFYTKLTVLPYPNQRINHNSSEVTVAAFNSR